MRVNHVLKTERLTLRKFHVDDAPFVVRLMNSPGWIEFIGDRNVRSDEAARSYLENGPMKSYRERGYGLWLVETMRPALPIGMCGILKRGTLDFPDLGFAFLPEYTGKGYAFEAASATLSYAFSTLQLGKIAAITTPANNSSIKLLTKLGLKRTGTYSDGNGSSPLLLFEADYKTISAGESRTG